MQDKVVLIIDDEPGIARALTVRLESLGYRVELASDGTTGIRAAGDFKPDVILLDIRLPDMSGFEVCQQLKADSALKAIPIVFLSANVKSDIKDEAKRLGGVAYITKPFQSQDVTNTIEHVLQAEGQNKPLILTGVEDEQAT